MAGFPLHTSPVLLIIDQLLVSALLSPPASPPPKAHRIGNTIYALGEPFLPLSFSPLSSAVQQEKYKNAFLNTKLVFLTESFSL